MTQKKNLNDISRQALEASAALCISRQRVALTPAHLLFKLLETPFSDVRQSLVFFSSRRRHTRWTGDWSSDVCSSDLPLPAFGRRRGRSPSRLARRTRQSRSEERRVGKECRDRWWTYDSKKKPQRHFTPGPGSLRRPVHQPSARRAYPGTFAVQTAGNAVL